jgi:tripartite-type tricarboxylate transporter receptor subunit TctC
MRMFVRFLIALACAAVLPAMAAAQSWPQRAVHFIVPVGAGSAVDITARLVAGRLSEIWGQPVVVENRPGGDTMVALTAFIRANDDHLLYFTPTGTFVMHPYLYDTLPYNAETDFQPIARVSNTIVGVFVPTSLNMPSLQALVAMVRAQPGKLNWTGSNNIADFVTAGYLKSEKLDMVQVPYRDVTAGVADVAAGRIQAGFMAYASARPMVDAGTVKILAVVTHARAAALPDTPTAIEAGSPGLTIEGLVGLFGPKSMSAQTRDKIAADVKKIIGDPAIATQLTASAQIVNFGGPAEFAAAIAEQRKTAAGVAALGVKALK